MEELPVRFVLRKLRATFGTYLLLGLEFLIASDILKTVLEPTLNELALLENNAYYIVHFTAASIHDGDDFHYDIVIN